MADLNRQKKSLVNRDWSSKSTKTNINYLKSKLKQFGLNIPNYLKQGKLTDNQIQTQSKRLLREMEKHQDLQRKKGVNNEMDRALKRLEKTVHKHKQLIAKRLEWTKKKYGLTDKQRDYLLGEELTIEGYKLTKNVTTRFDNSPFKFDNLENMYFSDVNAVNRRIKDINKKADKLKISEIQKFMKGNTNAVNSLKELLNDYRDSGLLYPGEVSMILREIKRLNGIEQNVFCSIFKGSSPKSKYLIADDDMNDFRVNLINKWLKIVDLAKNFG